MADTSTTAAATDAAPAVTVTARNLRDFLANTLPASDLLVLRLAQCAADYQAHSHPERGADLHCLNLVAYMGEHMRCVLRRLVDAETEIENLKARNTALADEATSYLDRAEGLDSDE